MTLHTTYFGPVEWYADLLHHADDITIDGGERYVKQTTRNHCLIATASGTQKLTVPVTAANGMLTKDVRISDHGNWRHLHWQALCSAYGQSPFFDYYADDLRPFYERQWDFLIDYNNAITEKMRELTGISDYLRNHKKNSDYNNYSDCNNYSDHKKNSDYNNYSHYNLQQYYQTFQRRNGFIPGLSVLDLLFNMGPESILYLIKYKH